MRGEPGIGVDAIARVLGVRTHESEHVEALTQLGAVLVFEFLQNVEAIVKGLSSAGK